MITLGVASEVAQLSRLLPEACKHRVCYNYAQFAGDSLDARSFDGET